MARRSTRVGALVLVVAALGLLVGPGAASAAGVAVASASSGSPDARSAITIARPAGTQAGDVMVAAVAINDDDPGFIAPAGWSLVRQDTVVDALRQAIYINVAGVAEQTSYTWTLSTTRRIAGGITTYRGVDIANPVDVHGAQLNTTTSTAVTSPSVTTTVPDTLLVHFAASATEGTISPPAAMTERWEATSPRASSTRDVTASSSDAVQVATGATGPRTATTTQAGRSIGAVLALRSSGPPLPDIIPPETTIDSGPSGSVGSTAATFAFSANEPATFECALDGVGFAPCTSPTADSGLADGVHVFTVRATDTAGNTDLTPALRTWTVDTSLPPPPTGIITTLAGQGIRGFSGDGGPAVNARLSAPRTLATDAAGNVYFVDTENNRVRRIDRSSGIITTIAGTGAVGFSGDGGPATLARLDTPHGIAVDGAGNVYVADPPNQRIRRIDTSGIITTIAGTGASGYNGDDRPATTARLNYPKGVEVGPDGLLYIADTDNHRVRRIEADGTITTVAGTGTAGFSGDGGLATSARFRRPRNTTFDGAGNFYIVDEDNNRVRRVNPNGIVTTFAGTGVAGYNGDNRLATTATLNLPRDVAVDATGNVYIAEERNHRIRRVDPAGIITTFAGTGVSGYNGDDRLATTARIAGPRGVAVTSAGNVLIADTANHRIRRVS